MAKAPEPGRSKTRLCPPLTLDQAAEVAEAALIDTLAAVSSCGATRRVIALDGVAGPWLPDGFEVIVQRGDGLDQRLAAAFSDVGERAVIIAMDTPQVTPVQLNSALLALDEFEAILGPTVDGGYWCIGLRVADIDVTTGVPMSQPDTWDHQLARIEQLGLSCGVVEKLIDMDELGDALTIAAMIPDSSVARCLAQILDPA